MERRSAASADRDRSLMGPLEADGVTEEWAHVRFVARCRQDGLCRGDLVDDAVVAKVCWSLIENVHDCSPVQGSLGPLCRCRSGKCRAGELADRVDLVGEDPGGDAGIAVQDRAGFVRVGPEDREPGRAAGARSRA